MATKKFLELQEFTDEDLKSTLTEEIATYEKQKFDHAIKGLDNPLVIRETRKNVARLQTEVRRREVEKMDEAAIAKRTKIRARRRK